jgi:predicted O-methyltransferase YrrM
MSRMLHRKGDPRKASQKVFIAVAAYEGCAAGFTYALFHTGAELEKAGIEYELAIYSGNCHVDDSRNRLVRDFLNSDCTDLVFLDADIGWFAKDFVALLGYDRDVVAGVYPKKNGDDTYPVVTKPGEIWSERDGLIEVEGVPTGFLRIRRAVLEAMASTATLYNAKNDRAMATPCIFERQIHDGTRWGGDYVFCRKARARGIKIYMAPSMRFEHSGEQTWTGSCGAWLKQRAGLGLVDGLKAIREGRETAEHLTDLFDAWDNPSFAASITLLQALATLARVSDGPILECGSGLSSLVLAAAAPHLEVHTLEDSPVYADHLRETAAKHGLDNLIIHALPIKDGWYDLGQLPFGERWGLVFIDGPRRTTGGRAETPDRIDLSRSVVVADDVQDDGGVPELRARLEQTHDVRICDSGHRQFAVCAPRRAEAKEAA